MKTFAHGEIGWSRGFSLFGVGGLRTSHRDSLSTIGRYPKICQSSESRENGGRRFYKRDEPEAVQHFLTRLAHNLEDL
jgi:hypothetical protein